MMTFQGRLDDCVAKYGWTSPCMRRLACLSARGLVARELQRFSPDSRFKLQVTLILRELKLVL